MGYRFKADGALGRVAIYESTDDAPWGDPLSYKSRVIFHSGLVYPARVATLTGSITLPARSNSSAPPGFESYTHQISAHGRSGIPMVEGRFIGNGDGGEDVPAIGSVPVQRYLDAIYTAENNRSQNWRWLTLGADATYVVLQEGVAPTYSGYATLPAVTISYEIHILDKVF